LWGGWLVTFFAVFTTITTLWPYYTAALSPAAAAIIGAGVAAARSRERAPVSLAAHSQSAFDTPFESARVQDDVALGLGKQAVIAVQGAIPDWQSTENGAPYVLAAQSALLPSAIIYDSASRRSPSAASTAPLRRRPWPSCRPTSITAYSISSGYHPPPTPGCGGSPPTAPG
jgi:hypothetical protein